MLLDFISDCQVIKYKYIVLDLTNPWSTINRTSGEHSNHYTAQVIIELIYTVQVKFELYKHSDELFNIYYGIFYELWNFDDFDRLCKLEKRADEIKKKQFGHLLA
jgi:hypothetical protein